MVVNALWIGGSLGVLISGAFVYVEVGRFAAPQVPRTLFDERKEFIGYTAGLFGGVALSIPFGLFLTYLGPGPLVWALVGLLLLVGGMEAAQWVVLRSRYFGTDGAGPFYAVGFRAGAVAILILVIATLYFGGGSITVAGSALVVLQGLAILGLEVAGALLAIPPPPAAARRSGGPLSGGLVTALGFFFLATGGLFGPLVGGVVALLVGFVAFRVYRQLRAPVLGGVRPPRAEGGAEGTTPSPFGRTDR